MTQQEIERTLKWYCLDCSCNDHCKEHKCAFYSFFKQYLEGDDRVLPPRDEWNVHHQFHRFHRQLLHNLKEDILNYKKSTETFDNVEWRNGYIKGMQIMLDKVRAEIEYLSKDK